MTSDEEEDQALLAYQIERDAEIVRTLVDDPALFARVRKKLFARRTDLVARADADIARRAMDEIVK